MNGFLDTDGNFYECDSYEHLSLAFKLARDNDLTPENSIKAEESLQKLGWIVIRTNDVYGLIGYPLANNSNTRYHLTKEQKNWLNSHYSKMTPSCQQSVDSLFEMDK